MRHIGLDLGTTTGWAYSDTHTIEPERSGSWKLVRKSSDRVKRCSRLHSELLALLRGHEQVTIYYEDVKGHKSTYSAQVYGSLRGIVELVAVKRDIELVPIHTAKVKQRATGRGNADKQAMAAACEIEFGFRSDDHDRVDAIYVLAAGLGQVT